MPPVNEINIYEVRAARNPNLMDALRYLAAGEPDYVVWLTTGSADTLARGGGPLQAAQYERFDAHPWRADALALREWDEAAKDDTLHLADHWRDVHTPKYLAMLKTVIAEK